MSETLDVSKEILNKIDEIEKLKKMNKEMIDKSAQAMSNYDKELALTIVKLRNGVAMEIDGVEIKDPPATIIEKIAKGIIYQARLDLEKAQGYVSGIKSNLMATQAQLNGLQSINRHLGEV